MPSITKEPHNELKYIVINYLQGADLDSISFQLQKECSRAKIGCKKLYRAVSLSKKTTPSEGLVEGDELTAIEELAEESEKLLQAILGSLNIKPNSEETPGQYETLLAKADNLHELLLLLYHDGYDHLGLLLELIETTRPRYRWTILLLLGTMTSALLGGLTLFKKDFFQTAAEWVSNSFPWVIDWLGKTFSILRNVPLLGIFYNGLGLIWSWYHTFSNGTTTPKFKLYQLFFKTLTAGFTLSAYLISFLAAGAMTFTGAAFFILSSFTKVIQGLFGWWLNSKTIESQTPTTNESWEVAANYIRSKSFHQHLLTSIWINISAAIVTTIAVGIWCIFPPNLLLTICCMSFISLTALTERSILASIKETSAESLQKELHDMKYLLPHYLTPGDKENTTKVERLYHTLLMKDQSLQAREQHVEKKEQLLDSLLSDMTQRAGHLFNLRFNSRSTTDNRPPPEAGVSETLPSPTTVELH